MNSIAIKSFKHDESLGNISIKDLTLSLFENDLIENYHRHDFYFLLIVEKGSGEHQIDFITYDVSDYSIFYLEPGQVHKLFLRKKTKGFIISIDKGFYSKIDRTVISAFHSLSSINYFSFTEQEFVGLNNILSQILDTIEQKDVLYLEALRFLFGLFFIRLTKQNFNVSTINSSKSNKQNILKSFEIMVNAHYKDHREIKYYLDNLKLSSYQLNAATKNLLGKSPSEIIVERIILEAKRLLMATSNQVKEIAYDLGFEDSSYFIRFFKKNTGTTPDEFRKFS